MNYLKKITITHCLILISFLMLSCGASHYLSDKVIYKDNNFTYDSLKNNALIIGGISSQTRGPQSGL